MGNCIIVNVLTVRRLRIYHESLLCIIDLSYNHYSSRLTRAMLSAAYLKHFNYYHSYTGNNIFDNVLTVRRLRIYHESLLCIIDGSYPYYPSHLTRA